MSDRYDLCTARKYTARDGQEKTTFTKIGTMWSTQGGKVAFSLTFDALPTASLGRDGQVETRVVAFPADQQRQAPRRDDRSGGGGYPGLDDEIPFSPCVLV